LTALRIKLIVALCLFVSSAQIYAAESKVELPTRPGVTQSFLVTQPSGTPVGSIILFTGGSGILGQTMKNFLIRSRGKFAAAGFLVASVDTPSDIKSGFNMLSRSSAAHAQDIAAVIVWLRQQAPGPVWLIGTSNGTISAANVAARLKTGGADGLVMTSSFVPAAAQSQPMSNYIDVGAIEIPTLFVHNKDDACPTSQIANVEPLMARFTHAPRKELITVSGGNPPQSDACESFAPHGYFGIENEVVGDIVRWIKVPAAI
jgi:pimeloyl-ACP methyl ester carboxylesterase